MIENESYFKSRNTLSLVDAILQRLKELDPTTEYPEPEVKSNFWKMYSYINNIQVADAVI